MSPFERAAVAVYSQFVPPMNQTQANRDELTRIIKREIAELDTALLKTTTFQLPVRFTEHPKGPRLVDAAGNVLALAVDGDDTGSLMEIAGLLNSLQNFDIIRNGELHD